MKACVCTDIVWYLEDNGLPRPPEVVVVIVEDTFDTTNTDGIAEALAEQYGLEVDSFYLQNTLPACFE